MREVRDTFLHFLSDNLAEVNIPVRAVRRDASDPSSEALQSNAVNVHFLDFDLSAHLSGIQAVIDVLNDDENTAVDWIGEVWKVLSASFYTPMLNYSNPASPAQTGFNVMWDRDRVRFRGVESEYYSHYSCVLTLRFRAK